MDIARRRNDQLAVKLLETAFRQQNLSSSTWKQKLRENKVRTPHLYKLRQSLLDYTSTSNVFPTVFCVLIGWNNF